MFERHEWRRAKGQEDELNKPIASVQILSLLNTICNMYMYITCMLLKEKFYTKG